MTKHIYFNKDLTRMWVESDTKTDRKVLIGDYAGNCFTPPIWQETSDEFTIELEKIMTKYEINQVCVHLGLIQEYVKQLGE